jgi:hypothetical protein
LEHFKGSATNITIDPLEMKSLLSNQDRYQQRDDDASITVSIELFAIGKKTEKERNNNIILQK